MDQGRGRASKPLEVCAAHGKPLDQYWWCEDFWTCEEGLREYTCHETEFCSDRCTHERVSALEAGMA